MKIISKVAKAVRLMAIVTIGMAIAKTVQRQYVGQVHVSSPLELSGHSWKQVLKEVKAALGNKNLSILAAGVAYFATLAFFPALAAFVSITALALSPDQVSQMVSGLETYVPADLSGLVNKQLQSLAQQDTTNLVTAIIALGLALWGASAGTQNLIKATNVAYGITESRNFIVQKLISIGLVIMSVVLSVVLLGLIVLRTDWLVALNAPHGLIVLFPVLRWLLIVVLVMFALAAFYRYGPNRKNPRWQWVSWGAAGATLIWLLGTLVFFFYAQNFGSFGKSYGVFAGIVILMTWLNLSAFIVLLGAEINHRLERQARIA